MLGPRQRATQCSHNVIFLFVLENVGCQQSVIRQQPLTVTDKDFNTASATYSKTLRGLATKWKVNLNKLQDF